MIGKISANERSQYYVYTRSKIFCRFNDRKIFQIIIHQNSVNYNRICKSNKKLFPSFF